MKWMDWMPVVTGVLYTAAALGYARDNVGLAIAYAGYAAANVGLVLVALTSR